VRVAVRKLPGVESVEVSLERATAEIRLRPDNRVTVAQLRKIVRDNGFTAKEATVTAAGTLVERGGRPALSQSGTEVVWLLAPAASAKQAYADAVQQLKSAPGRVVEAVGTLAAPGDPNAPDELVTLSLKPSGK
jgi:copper chaperone CopZ